MSPLTKIGIPVCIGIIGILTLSSEAQDRRTATVRESDASTRQAQKIDYNFEVRPILSDNCFRCHGPDAKSRQAGLRLDQKDSAYAQAINPGKPDQSELIK